MILYYIAMQTFDLNFVEPELKFFVQKYCNLFIISVLTVIAATFLVTKSRRSTSGTDDKKTEIPGRLGLPFLGESLAFLSATKSSKGCYEFVRLRRLRHGDIFKTRLFGKIHVFIPTVESAKTVYSNDFKLFNKGYLKSMADVAGRNSMFSVPEESHKRIRRILFEPFSMQSLSHFVPKFDAIVCDRLKKCEEENKSFSVFEFCSKVTFASTCNMLTSITDESLLNSMEKDCDYLFNGILAFPFMIPRTRYYRAMKARERLLRIFKEIIVTRRSRKEALENDILQSLLEKSSLPPNEKLSDDEILDNLLTMLMAGHVSSSAAMTWCVKFLDDNKEAQGKLREEQLSIARQKPLGAPLTLEDINKMSYGSKVVKETLRMANAVLWVPRVALSDCIMEGYAIKKGWHVNIDTMYIHNDPNLYPEPSKFNPSRFDETPKPYSFVPFGSGPRTCVGMNMGRMAMLIFLHRLTSAYKWTVDDPDTSLEKNVFTPRLKSGCPITLKPL